MAPPADVCVVQNFSIAEPQKIDKKIKHLEDMTMLNAKETTHGMRHEDKIRQQK